jgi:hypothetical protein
MRKLRDGASLSEVGPKRSQSVRVDSFYHLGYLTCAVLIFDELHRGNQSRSLDASALAYNVVLQRDDRHRATQMLPSHPIARGTLPGLRSSTS